MSRLASGPALGASWVGVGVLALLGCAFVFAPEFAFQQTGHDPHAIVTVMGGRYFGLALAVAAFSALKDSRGLSVIFAVGMFLGIFDAIAVAGSESGRVAPHAGAALASALLAVWHFRIWRSAQ